LIFENIELEKSWFSTQTKKKAISRTTPFFKVKKEWSLTKKNDLGKISSICWWDGTPPEAWDANHPSASSSWPYLAWPQSSTRQKSCWASGQKFRTQFSCKSREPEIYAGFLFCYYLRPKALLWRMILQPSCLLWIGKYFHVMANSLHMLCVLYS